MILIGQRLQAAKSGLANEIGMLANSGEFVPEPPFLQLHHCLHPAFKFNADGYWRKFKVQETEGGWSEVNEVMVKLLAYVFQRPATMTHTLDTLVLVGESSFKRAAEEERNFGAEVNYSLAHWFKTPLIAAA